jgi:hypothetical protein
MKKIVIYKSQSGFTKKYATWIAEELNCQVCSMKEAKKINLREFDLILYGGGVHASTINGLKEIKKQLGGLNKDRDIIFCTGATPSEEIKIINAIQTKNFDEEEIERIPFFYLQSGLNYDEMEGVQRFVMKIFANMLQKKTDKTEEETAMADMIKASYDITDRKFITPIINLVKEKEVSK